MSPDEVAVREVMEEFVPCRTCDGEGYVCIQGRPEGCNDCHGTGSQEKADQLEEERWERIERYL